MPCELYQKPIGSLNQKVPPTFETWCQTHDCAKGGVQCLRSVMYDVAHLAATLGSGSDGHLRGRFMSISNALNAAIGRQQSSHGDQYDPSGSVIVRPGPLNA